MLDRNPHEIRHGILIMTAVSLAAIAFGERYASLIIGVTVIGATLALTWLGNRETHAKAMRLWRDQKPNQSADKQANPNRIQNDAEQ